MQSRTGIWFTRWPGADGAAACVCLVRVASPMRGGPGVWRRLVLLSAFAGLALAPLIAFPGTGKPPPDLPANRPAAAELHARLREAGARLQEAAERQQRVLRQFHSNSSGPAPDHAARRPGAAAAAAAANPMPAPPPACARGAGALRIAHFVNLMPRDSGHHADQEVTIASLTRAWEEARRDPRGPCVELFTLGYDDEWERRVPRDEALFRRTRGLASEAFHVYEQLAEVGEPYRRLPLLSELLDVMYDEAPAADVIVFTNADIGVQPYFYQKVAARLPLRRDAGASSAPPRSLSINRVEIGLDGHGPLGVAQLDRILALGQQLPQNHAGHDCFVFERRSVPFLRLYLRGTFLGYPPVGSKLVDALRCVSNYQLISGRHLTFHLGVKNGGWGQWSAFEYYNRKAAKHSEQLFAGALSTPRGEGRRTRGAAAATAAGATAACAKVRGAQGGTARALVRQALDEYRRDPIVKPDVPPPQPPPGHPRASSRGGQHSGAGTRGGSGGGAGPAGGVAAAAAASAASAAAGSARCLDPRRARPAARVRRLIIASSGRVGSTMLAEVLGRLGVQVEHSHLSASEIEAREARKPNPTPVLFIFADPVDVILSLRQRDLDTGDSFFGKGISWVRKHLENMNIPEAKFEAWQREEYFEADVLDLAAHFDDWHRPHRFPMMSLRYETERAHMDDLATFLGLAAVVLPPSHAKIKGSRGKVPRAERFRRLEPTRQRQLNATYGDLRGRIRAAPDACIWAGTAPPAAP